MPKKRRVPKILWELFKGRARTLATTVTSLISSSPSQSCHCNSQLCRNCSAISFLLRPRDPADYKKLLYECFVVVNENAPPLTAAELRPRNNWSQHEIVVRTIEMMMRDQFVSAHVICSAYDKFNHSSPIVELLTSSAWSLLLERVGDDFMVYLLKHTTIFLPLPPKKHQQVTGPPVTNLVFKSMKHAAQPQCQDPSVIHFEHRKKRVRVDDANSRVDIEQHNPSSVMGSSSCIACHGRGYIKPSRRHPAYKSGHIGVSENAAQMIVADFTKYEELPSEELLNPRKRSRPFRWKRYKKRKHSDMKESSSIRSFNRCDANRSGQVKVLENVSPTTEACPVKHGGFSNEALKDLNRVIEKPKKKSRLFRWQRRRKRKHLDDEEASDKICDLMDSIDKDSAPKYELSSSKSLSNMPHQCSCCHVQAPHLATKGVQINRRSIFYNLGRPSSVLPQKHMLYSLKPDFAGSRSLIQSIFGLSVGNINAALLPCSHSSDFCFIGSTCLYHSLAKLLGILIRRSRRCKYMRLLDKHCMVSSLSQIPNQQNTDLASEFFQEREISKKSHGEDTENFIRTPGNRDLQTEAVKSYCLKSQVVSFIWAVCRKLVPPDLLGTPSNWRILRRNISKFIQLRRYEKFSLKQCLHKLKISEFPFLSGKNSFCKLGAGALLGQNLEMHKGLCKFNYVANNLKHMFLEKWIFWFFSCLVVPLLQAHFYITETEHGKQDIFYYRKSIWEKLKNETVACLKDQNYLPVDATDVESIISNRLFGFSKLRLCPKMNRLRMLANLKAPSRMLLQEPSPKGRLRKPQFSCKSVKYKYFKSVNCVLRDTHAVLKGIQLKEPEKLGSSVFDYNDIYRKLCPFIIGLSGSSSMPNIFIVVSDVSKAFDSIDQDKLLCVMRDVIHEDEYRLQQSSQVFCTKKSFWVRENLTLEDPGITDFTNLSSAPFGSLNAVLINQGLSKYMKKKELLFNLDEHVKRNIVQLDKAFYLQGIGIPQGSILSSLLCSLYYGHLERNFVFPYLEKTCESTVEDLYSGDNSRSASAAGNSSMDTIIPSPYILLRLIDDFCFISTSKKQAASFYARLRRGFCEYNCYMNEEKFCLNFDIGHASELPSNRVYVGDDGIVFLRWSGLLLNSRTLEVQADYTRYLDNHLRSSLTVSWHGKPGRNLKFKLLAFMRPKCHPIFFDSNINSGAVVRLNIYQAFLICAMKFHCYVSEMLYMCKLQPISHLRFIAKTFRYMYMLIEKRMRSAHTSSHFHPVLQLEAAEVEWLGLNAFIKVLKRKQSRHKELLCLLNSKLLAHKINGNASPELKYAVDSSHSSVMWKINY